MTRSAKSIKQAESDRAQHIDGPDPDSRVWETPCTPPPQTTHDECSAHGDGSVRDSRTENEPVAWAVMERDGFGIEGLFPYRDEAADWCGNRQQIVPLYRHRQPTLTDAEREAVEAAVTYIETPIIPTFLHRHAATLRGLLERLR